MEDYNISTDVHKSIRGQIRGQAAFNLYCRQPDTRMDKIMRDIARGADCVNIAVAYDMDFETALVYKKVYDTYGHSVTTDDFGTRNDAKAKNGPETDCNGIEMTGTYTICEGRAKIYGVQKRKEAASTSSDQTGTESEKRGDDWKRTGYEMRNTAVATDGKATRCNGGLDEQICKASARMSNDMPRESAEQLRHGAESRRSETAGRGADLMRTMPDIVECVRVLLADGAGISRIAKRLNITRTQATIISRKIERGEHR